MKTLHDFIQIEIEKPKNQTTHGLIITGTKEKLLERGKVVSIGQKVEEVKKGDMVIFKQFSTDTVELDGIELSFIRESDVLAIV